jgi:two-component system, sensor histidine kinase and response regulator
MPKLIGEKILIVDACKTNCRILDHEASNGGLISTSTYSAKEALRLIQSGHSFDIALLDINTTDMYGITLATNIKKIDVNLPLMALTSVGQHVKPGIFALTASKPIRHLKLRDKIISLLEKKSPAEIHPQIETAAKKSTLNILLTENNILNQKVFMTNANTPGLCK